MSSRVAIFVDGANMFYAQRENGWFIEYKRILEFFTTNKEQAMAYYFTATPPPSETERWTNYRRFREALIRMGYIVIDKEVRIYKDDKTGQVKVKGNLDIDMAFAMLSGMDKYDEAVILGGDSDFIPVFTYLRSSGKEVICVGKKSSTALDLINASTRFIELNQLRDRVEKHNKRRGTV